VSHLLCRNRRGVAESLNLDLYLRARCEKEKIFTCGRGDLQKSAVRLLRRDLPRLMVGAETASYVGRNFLFLCATRGNAMDAIYCESLILLRLFSILFPLHPWRDTGRPVHTALPNTFSGITVMQSLKVKHDAIIRRDILRVLASFLRVARKTSTRTTMNEGTILRSVSIRKVRIPRHPF